MNPPRIRRYARRDFEDVVKICNESLKNCRSCWPNPMTPQWFMKRFGSVLESETGTVFIAECDGTPVGYVLLSRLSRPQVGLVALIRGIGVTPRFQRKGIGSRLVEKAIDWAKNQGAVLIESDDEIIENPVAISFFEKLGFEIFHRGVYMSKKLRPDGQLPFPENVEIRELRLDDLDQLLVVRRKSFEEFGPWYSRPDAEAFRRGMRDRIGRSDVKVYVAVINKAVIGYVVASIDEIQRETGTIRVVCVLPRHRRRNIGTALLENSFRFLRENNVETVDTVTETAEGFYRKVGFKEDAEFVRVRKWLS